MKNLADKVVVITGAGSGIGRALAHKCAARGARVALSDVNEKSLQETVADLPPEQVFTQTLDVADRAAFEAHAAAVIEHYGQADVIINNAGVAVSQTVDDLSYEDFEWIMGINFWGVVYGTKAFLPELRKRPEAAVINISSVFGIIAVPTQGAYNATKFAVRGFTEALRLESEGTGLHVMCVHPGGIRANIAKAARWYKDPTGEASHKTAAQQFEKLARTTPEQAAEKILKDLARKSPRCLIGTDAQAIDLIQRSMPERYGKLINKLLGLGKK